MKALKILLNIVLILALSLLFTLDDVCAAVVNQNKTVISGGWTTKDYITIGIAIAGFLLGLTNTGILVYKEFFKKEKKPSFEVKCDKALIREIGGNRWNVDIQINATIRAIDGKNTIKKVEMIYSGTEAVFGVMGAGYKHQTFGKSYDYWNCNFLYEYKDPESFENKLKELNTNNEYVKLSNLPLDESQSLSISLIDRFVGFRFPDGYEDIPKGNWILEVTDSEDNKYSTSFDFVDYKTKDERESMIY
ncbi:hypothetical protein COJ70_24340 [Priestia megaterium]|uniref:hypothetical protein n=1 Tax=Priestia megaterium TaxID=1404 RepID=UPI000BF57B50|nr:hypothetical protein [Priestia megaterium]PFO12701.1 hypothetical protein COJ70_24340 [Priestia megaterium]